jgi:hypothetical protein
MQKGQCEEWRKVTVGEAMKLEEGRGVFFQVPRLPVEGNLLVFPTFLLSQATPGRKGWFSYKRTIVHESPSGQSERIEQEWIVAGDSRLGLTRALDLDVCMGLVEIADKSRGGMPKDGVVWFSLHELRDLLGWSKSGRNNERLRESIERTTGTSITSRNAFWSARRQSWISKKFSLWDSDLRHYRDSVGRSAERHHVRFDDLVVEGFLDGHVRMLDPIFYRSLRSSLSKRLYMLADHHCANERDGEGLPWEIRTDDLVELMPLARYDRPSEVERIMAGAHEELGGAGYLRDVEIERGKRGAPLAFRYELQPSFLRSRLGAEIERHPGGAIALEKMRQEGVALPVRVALIAEYGADYCGRYAELLPYFTKKGRGESAGLLVDAIRSGWPWEQRAERLPKNLTLSAAPGVPDPPQDLGAARSAAAERRREGYEWLFGEGS